MSVYLLFLATTLLLRSKASTTSMFPITSRVVAKQVIVASHHLDVKKQPGACFEKLKPLAPEFGS